MKFQLQVGLLTILMAATVLPTVGQSCGAATIAGSYGYSFPGLAGGPPAGGKVPTFMPTSAIGRITLTAVSASDGSLEGVQTTNFGGSTSGSPFSEHFTGTYGINTDCTGTLTRTFSGGTVVHWYIVAADGGSEIEIVNADNGYVVSGRLKRQ